MINEDCEYLQSASGESGGLSSADTTCGSINNFLTRSIDHIFSPDSVDSFDASCNTCKHFVRRAMTPEEKSERNVFGMPGYCQKKDIDTRGWQRGQYCGFENADCYENRRTGMRPKDGCKLEAA